MSPSPSPPPTSSIRRDAVLGRTVLFSPARSSRPSDLKSHSQTSSTPTPNSPNCPFCAGNEHLCAPQILRKPQDSPDWKIRVIENLYPALRRDIAAPPDGEEGEWGVLMTGFGFHDVVIETPRHDVNLVDLDAGEIGEVVMVYKERVLQLMECGGVKYAQIFKNYGASAGASLAHSHSQIMGLPLVPPLVTERLDCMKKYFDRTGKCSICEVLSDDILINESAHFFAIAPFASSCPFEVWIVPRDHTAHFHEIDGDKAADLGSLLKLMLQKLSKQLNDPPYNFIVQTAPFELPASCLPHTHWFLQIVPHLGVIGGFEIGTGCFINPVFPEDAAKVLREVDTSS